MNPSSGSHRDLFRSPTWTTHPERPCNCWNESVVFLNHQIKEITGCSIGTVPMLPSGIDSGQYTPKVPCPQSSTVQTGLQRGQRLRRPPAARIAIHVGLPRRATHSGSMDRQSAYDDPDSSWYGGGDGKRRTSLAMSTKGGQDLFLCGFANWAFFNGPWDRNEDELCFAEEVAGALLV